MKYEIEFVDSAAKKFMFLPGRIQGLIMNKLLAIAQDPYASNNNIRKMVGAQKRYRLRQGNYRIVYDLINGKLILQVVMIGHRSEVYR